MRHSDVDAVADLCGQLGYPATGDQIARRWSAIASNPAHAVFIAADGSRVLGWLHVAVRPLLEYDLSAEISGVVVDERDRGAGLGGALVDAAEVWASAAGCTRIRVRSRIERDRAHAFYERAGYGRLKTQHVFEKTLASH